MIFAEAQRATRQALSNRERELVARCGRSRVVETLRDELGGGLPSHSTPLNLTHGLMPTRSSLSACELGEAADEGAVGDMSDDGCEQGLRGRS